MVVLLEWLTGDVGRLRAFSKVLLAGLTDPMWQEKEIVDTIATWMMVASLRLEAVISEMCTEEAA